MSDARRYAMLRNLYISCAVALGISFLYVVVAAYYGKNCLAIAEVVVPCFIAVASFVFSILSSRVSKNIALDKKTNDLLAEFSSEEISLAKQEWGRISEIAFTGENSFREEHIHWAQGLEEVSEKTDHLRRGILTDLSSHFSSYSENDKVQPLFRFISHVAIAIENDLITYSALENIMEGEISDLLRYGAFYLESATNRDKSIEKKKESLHKVAEFMGVMSWCPEFDFTEESH